MSTEQCQLQETWSRPQSLQAGILQLEMDHRNRCSVYVMVLEEVVTFAKGQGDYCSLDMLNKSLLSSSWVDQFKETRLSLSVAVWSSLVPGDLHGLMRQLSHATSLEHLYDRFSKQCPIRHSQLVHLSLSWMISTWLGQLLGALSEGYLSCAIVGFGLTRKHMEGLIMLCCKLNFVQGHSFGDCICS